MTIRFELDPYKRKDGKRRIRAVYSYEGRHTTFSTKEAIQKEYWSRAKGKVKPSHEDSELINQNLEKVKGKIDKARRLVQAKGLEPLPARVKAKLRKKDVPQTFWEGWDRFLSEHEEEIGKSTKTSYKNARRNLETFEKIDGKLTFERMTGSWRNRYFKWMKNTGIRGRGNKETSIGLSLLKISAFLNYGLENEWHTNKDFQKWKIPKTTTEEAKIAFTLHQLEKLQVWSPDSEKNGRRRDFLVFMSHTGLRPTEAMALPKDCVNTFIDDQGKMWGVLTWQNKKGKKRNRLIPLTSVALEIWLKHDGQILKESLDGYNVRIKEIARSAGIKNWHEVSAGVGRHTFGTIVSNSLGIRPANIMMDHEDTRTTEVYAHRRLKTQPHQLDKVFKT